MSEIIKISKMSIGGGKMANHIKYIDIHKFKGIKDINIYDMKSINIFQQTSLLIKPAHTVFRVKAHFLLKKLTVITSMLLVCR